jgi:hypothetical protein
MGYICRLAYVVGVSTTIDAAVGRDVKMSKVILTTMQCGGEEARMVGFVIELGILTVEADKRR